MYLEGLKAFAKFYSLIKNYVFLEIMRVKLGYVSKQSIFQSHFILSGLNDYVLTFKLII